MLRKIEKDTGQTPKALLDRPQLSRWSEDYWKAFQELSSSRNWTQSGPTEIPYLAKLAWLDENFIHDPDERDEYLRVIQALDFEYIEHILENR